MGFLKIWGTFSGDYRGYIRVLLGFTGFRDSGLQN